MKPGSVVRRKSKIAWGPAPPASSARVCAVQSMTVEVSCGGDRDGNAALIVASSGRSSGEPSSTPAAANEVT